MTDIEGFKGLKKHTKKKIHPCQNDNIFKIRNADVFCSFLNENTAFWKKNTLTFIIAVALERKQPHVDSVV